MEPNGNNDKNPQSEKQKKLIVGAVAILVIVAALIFAMKNRSGEFPNESQPVPTQSATAPEMTPAPTDTAPVPEASPVSTDSATAPKTPEGPIETDAQGLSKIRARLETSKGVVEFKFYPKDAPSTVKRIVELTKSGFYNGLSFHRVVPGFVVQGGDPTGTGGGGSGQKLKAEFNSRKHLVGTVAMARTPEPDSADSQFYICLNELPSLDNQYTVFGQVVTGMDVVQKIAVGDKITKATIVP